MKYILLLLLFIGACTVPVEPVQDGKEQTTVRMLEMPADTLQVVVDGEFLYILEDGVLKYKTIQYLPDNLRFHEMAILWYVVGLIIMLYIGLGIGSKK